MFVCPENVFFLKKYSGLEVCYSFALNLSTENKLLLNTALIYLFCGAGNSVFQSGGETTLCGYFTSLLVVLLKLIQMVSFCFCLSACLISTTNCQCWGNLLYLNRRCAVCNLLNSPYVLHGPQYGIH